MTNSPILKIPQVAPNQNQKEATINTGIGILEASANDQLVVDLSAGDVTLNSDQFTKYFTFRCQGHTVSTDLNTFLTKRVFIVSNEGTGDVVVHCGTSLTDTVTVAASKIVLISSDGVSALRALSSGVGLLTDLSDVDAITVTPADGNVLKYNGTTHKWEAGPFSAAVFTGLTDVPAAYTGAAKKLVRVNAAVTGLEFYAKPYPISGGRPGVPAATQLIFTYVFAEAVKLLSGIGDAQFKFYIAPTADTTLTIYKNIVTSIGTVVMHNAGAPTITFSSDITFAAGDTLSIVAPGTPDATAADFTATFLGVSL